jgi:hypothetical protein
MFSSSPGAVYEVKNNDVQGIRGRNRKINGNSS